MIAFGDDWGSWFIELLATWPGGTWLELILPFSPMGIIASGVVILARCRVKAIPK